MVQIIATKQMRYASRRLEAGESFEASDRDAKVLIAARKASKKAVFNPTNLPVRAAEPVAEADPSPISEPETEAAQDAPATPRKRTYQRRDLKAED